MKILVTGGLGFIGCNAAHYFDSLGHEVTVIDNYYRPGVDKNEQWLRSVAPDVHIRRLDIRKGDALKRFVGKARFDIIIHEAAQTAVTTSVKFPGYDFETNAGGTFNVMEAAREHGPVVIYASTNKVYGGLGAFPVYEEETRWRLNYDHILGIGEDAPLDPISPYGCSKLAGEHYVRDYARIYGCKTVSFRQSCIYGPHQLGGTDQGWVTWFCRAWMQGKPITIFGDGKQVRDILHVADLLQAYLLAISKIDEISGQVFNVGGGPDNSTSIWWELKPLMKRVTGKCVPKVMFSKWRPGDQKVHITNNRKLADVLGWKPKISMQDGIEDVCRWISGYSKLQRKAG